MRATRKPFVKAMLFGFGLTLLGACGQQEPSFTSETDASQSGDAIQNEDKDRSGGVINDHGVKKPVAQPHGETGTGSKDSPPSAENGSKNEEVIGGGGNGNANGSGSGSGNGGENNGGDGVEGIQFKTIEMNIVQESPKTVDILWVVDNSGSMKEEQDYLGTNFSKFITELEKVGTNYQTAITTTDACDKITPSDLTKVVCPSNEGSDFHRGAFIGNLGRKVLKKGDSDIASLFRSYTGVGIEGSGFEHGLYSAELAVQKSLAGVNESLIRKDSFLSIIVVSDEEDDGIGLGMTDAYSGINYVKEGYTKFKYNDDNLINYLSSVKGKGNFSISTITGTRLSSGTLCSSLHSKPKEEGTQYIKAATKTGGVIQSICSYNWDQSLYELGKDIRAQISQIALEKLPIKDSIQVSINGVVTQKWQYLEGTNAIKFNAESTPYTGDKIKVVFKTLVN